MKKDSGLFLADEEGMSFQRRRELWIVVNSVVKAEIDKGQDDEGSVGNAHGQEYYIQGNSSRLQKAAILMPRRPGPADRCQQKCR